VPKQDCKHFIFISLFIVKGKIIPEREERERERERPQCAASESFFIGQ
jgi:hypothetical protein